MSYIQNPELKQRMELAKTILLEAYKDFEKLINRYKVNLDTPEWDIICFHALTKIMEKKQKKEKWYAFWSKNRKPLRFENFNYRVPISYYSFCCSDETSKYFLEILDYYYQNNQKLSWDIFLQIFFDYRSKIMPKFNKLEFLVFQTIMREQTLSNNQLVDKLSMDSSNLSKYKRKLKERQLIYEGLSLNYSVLDMAIYGIVYNVPLSSKIDFFKELPESSFLHSIYTSYSNSQSVMVHYVAPDKPQVKIDLQKLCDGVTERNDIISSNIFKFDTSSRLKSFNFANYDYKNGQWILPYYKIISALEKEKASENNHPLILSEFVTTDKKILNLNKIGIEILNHLLMHNVMSIKSIKKDLDISEKEARKHVGNFRKHHYFKSRVNPNYVFGLSNLVLFLSKDPSEQLNIHQKLSIFPELYSQKYLKEDEEGLHFIIRIPNEMIFDCMNLFNSVFKHDVKEMFVINQMYSRRWMLPTERYETVFQEWKYDSKDILGDGE